MSEDHQAALASEYSAENVQIRAMPESFYGLMDAICQRPSLYLGRKSLQVFDSWLHGYQYAKLEARAAPSEDEQDFGRFDEFFKLLDEFRKSKRQQRDQS